MELKVKFSVLNFPSRNKFRKWLDSGQECDLANCGRLKPYGLSALVYYEDRIPYVEDIPAEVEVKDNYVPLPILSFLYRKELAVKVVKPASIEDKFMVKVEPIAEGFSILHPSDRFNPNFGKLTALQDLLDTYGLSLDANERKFVEDLIEMYSEKVKPGYSIVVFKETSRDVDGNIMLDNNGIPVAEGYNYKEKFESIEELLEWMFHEEPENYLVYQSLPGGKKKVDIVKDDGTGIYRVA